MKRGPWNLARPAGRRIGALVLACALALTHAQPQDVFGQEPPQGKAASSDDKGQPAPAKPRKPAQRATKGPDGQVRQDGFGPAAPAEPVKHGGARDGKQALFKDLAAGDALAWTVVIGLTLSTVLGAVAGIWWKRSRMAGVALDPAQIVAAWQQQRGLCFVGVAVLVIGIGLGALLAVASQTVVPLFVCLFASLLVGMVLLTANLCCPACGSSMGKDWGPTFCPKCGVALQEAVRPSATAPVPRQEN